MLDLAEDLYCGSLSQEAISDFTCMLCYGIVQDPVKCNVCDTMYCATCNSINDPEKDRRRGRRQQKCFKQCKNSKMVDLTRLEKHLLNSLVFICPNDCGERVPYCKYESHLTKECGVKTYMKVEKPNEPENRTKDSAKRNDEIYDLNLLFKDNEDEKAE